MEERREELRGVGDEGDWTRVGGEGKTKRGVKEEVRRRGVGEEWRGGAEMRRGEGMRRRG